MRLSVVMATRNSAAHLQRALDSVPKSLGAAPFDFEIVVADGKSSDDTRQIAAAAPTAMIASTADLGIYDGMNKAIAAASGDVLIILNSDDELLRGGLATALAALDADPLLDAVLGSVAFGTSVQSAILRRADRALSAEGVLFGIPVINARVFRRSVLLRAGPFRTDLGLGADRELLLRILALNVRSTAMEQPLYFYREHAGSHTLANDRDGRARVYASDLQLSSALLAEPRLSPSDRTLVEAFTAVALMKNAKLDPSAHLPKLLSYRSVTKNLARGLIAHRTWRGRLSGW